MYYIYLDISLWTLWTSWWSPALVPPAFCCRCWWACPGTTAACWRGRRTSPGPCGRRTSPARRPRQSGSRPRRRTVPCSIGRTAWAGTETHGCSSSSSLLSFWPEDETMRSWTYNTLSTLVIPGLSFRTCSGKPDKFFFRKIEFLGKFLEFLGKLFEFLGKYPWVFVKILSFQ